MADPKIPAEVQSSATASTPAEGVPSSLFALPPTEPSGRGKIIAAAVVLGVLAVFAAVFFLHGKTPAATAQNVVLPADPYAQNLVFTQLAMSESTSLSGGKSTFIDGHVKNAGANTLTGVSVQVLFRNDVGLSPQVEIVPLTLVRTHEPYVDTEPMSAAPLKPGDDAEFRLIFETVNENWNQQMPQLEVVRVARR